MVKKTDDDWNNNITKKLSSRKNHFNEEYNSIVYIEGRIYISNNKKIWEQILQEHHNPADIGHPGQQRMIKLIKRNYWWLEIK